MLSYRHAYHAGSPADVLKHAVLVGCVLHLQQKPGGIRFIDTHAGAGLYRLDTREAATTGEAAAGILGAREAARTGDVPVLLAPYLDRVLPGLDAEPPVYPGSARLIAELLRPQDRATFIELHPTDHALLAEAMRRDRRITVLREDSLATLARHLPPPERRALLLIDPSYEIKTDFERIPDVLSAAHRRFATGMMLLWYPVIQRRTTEAMLEAIAATGMRRILRIELCLAPDSEARGMTGSGMLVVNPPFTLAATAEASLPWLRRAFRANGPAGANWLVPE